MVLSRREQLDIIATEYAWHDEHPSAQDVFWRPELIEFLTRYFGGPPVLRYPQTGLRQRGAPTHADGITPWVDPPGADLRVWIALEDINPAAGPVYFVPGSHQITAEAHAHVLAAHPEFADLLPTASALRKADPTARNPTYDLISRTNAYLEEVIRARRLSRAVPTLSCGDAVVFRTDLAHGTMPCADMSLTRKHALAFFSSPDAVWHSETAYWGETYDHRTPENAVRWQRTETRYGWQQVAVT